MKTAGSRNASFVHLHTHSEFSLLDGASRVRELVGKAAELGMPAVAITDHGVMFGALDFYAARTATGIKPIIGVEAYVAPGSRFDRERGENEEKYRHLTILARNEGGYRNLLRLVTDAHLEGFYHRPRIDKELLAERSEGLIGLSGCLAGETNRLLLAGQHAKADEVAATYRDIFGPDGFYLELQDHGLAEQRTGEPHADRAVRATRDPARGDQRPPLHRADGRPSTRRPALHPAAEGPDRHEPAEVRLRRVLPEVRRGDAGTLRRGPRGMRRDPRDRRGVRAVAVVR